MKIWVFLTAEYTVKDRLIAWNFKINVFRMSELQIINLDSEAHLDKYKLQEVAEWTA